MMFISRRISNKTFIVYIFFLVATLAYNEVYQYHMKKWNRMECKRNCTKILLVADPQLIGLKNEVLHFLTPLAIWDSDRYLKKTYMNAYKFTQPDVVIFLGDLFDEGSRATNSEFTYYADRFFDVFNIPFNPAKNIYIPGDNDIGGEGYEIVLKESLMNFEVAFFQQDILNVGNNTFYKINRLTKSWPKLEDNLDFYNIDKIRIGLSHVPLIFRPGGFVSSVLQNLQPHLIFAAHEHKSMIVSMDGIMKADRIITPVSEELNDVYTYTLGIDDMYEIVVPTCSYRMGTKRMGYGIAIIENGEFSYTVLWSPSRFDQLKNYLWFAALSLMYLFLKCIVVIYRCCRKSRRPNGYTRVSTREN